MKEERLKDTQKRSAQHRQGRGKDGGRLAGWEATRFDSHGKPEALRDMARRRGLPLSRTAFVGDGENDVPLLGVAGYFAAFRPRSSDLIERADIVLGGDELPRLLEIFE